MPRFSPCRLVEGRLRLSGLRLSFFLFLIVSILQISTIPCSAAAVGSGSGNGSDEARRLPQSLGKIVYRYNENSSKTLYIIGIDHRDPLRYRPDGKTVAAQNEIYRIGEWLQRNRNTDLLLPEGFFGNSEISRPRSGVPDDGAIRRELADDSRFVNAEMLLMEYDRMRACQVEDRHLYSAVLDRLVKLEKAADDPAACVSLQTEIDSLQQKRTTAILQKIPSVIQAEYASGRIPNRNALFTIGLKHIGTIIHYLENDGTRVGLSPSDPGKEQARIPELDLLKEGFGIVIIIPRSLVHEDEVLRPTELAGL